MRPGRLDRLLYVGPPEQKDREEILKIRLRKMSVESDVDVEEIARLVRPLAFETFGNFLHNDAVPTYRLTGAREQRSLLCAKKRLC